jgi:hypothetical protein
MSNERDSDPFAAAAAKGSTRTDLRLTRAPADTPRGRLHALAARGYRAAREARAAKKLDQDDMSKLRAFARRGVDKLRRDESRGARLVVYLCRGLDAAIGPLTLLDASDVVAVCEGLSLTLTELEVSENTIRKLKADLNNANQDVQLERSCSRQLRAQLAEMQNAVARREASDERWNETTRKSEVTAEVRSILDDPEAQ